MTEKRRRRTGCLTCRTRRVKCDERKPDCERCEVANIECSGYAEKRRLKTRHPGQSTTTTETHNGVAPPPASLINHEYLQPKPREDGLPLMALPVNPNPFQRPHSRARDMLGYHQYLYRTSTILFAPKSFHFWRDYLCEAAWETEWVFDAIVALGSMHRATLLLSKQGGSDRDRGLDTKIAAIQTYIRALEGVSREINQTKSPTPLAVGVLILMAYIESSLRDLELICRIVRPFPSPLEPNFLSNAEKLTVNLPASFFELGASSSSILIQQLLEFTSADLDLKHLIWCVYAAHYKTASREKILAFLQALDDWKTYNSTLFQTMKADDFQPDLDEFSYQGLGKFPFPPLPHKHTSWESCLVLALYSFYKARLLWALCLLGDQDRKIELDSYFHVYELLRYTRTALTISHRSSSLSMVMCENLRIGFSPLLYLAGRCCPSAPWLRWIIQELENVGPEGIFQNKQFAATLDLLLSLEELKTRDLHLSSDGANFVHPSMRTIAVFIPDIDGRSFEAYYGRLRGSSSDNGNDTQFALSKVAHWLQTTKDSEPSIEDYEIYPQPFSPNWLMEQPIVKKWLDWSCVTEFDLNQVIQDHIAGNRLLLEIGVEA
ncbi:hypothetical protein N7481_003726 [Penicillium waksmanii]|uniref:uncharacterized protein n=1 Tax=Penicillium waksmanii TaxID=69791 RepID=UPI0025478FE9|nr:uncharacterized protein N7481_003726 [Penicillium waksmanii]KAJ5988516.1 hypothetical protein N7481_003726 [Penicillium waksmanii]